MAHSDYVSMWNDDEKAVQEARSMDELKLKRVEAKKQYREDLDEAYRPYVLEKIGRKVVI